MNKFHPLWCKRKRQQVDVFYVLLCISTVRLLQFVSDYSVHCHVGYLNSLTVGLMTVMVIEVQLRL